MASTTHPENLSHDVHESVESVQVLHLNFLGQAQVHRAGCAHAMKADHAFGIKAREEFLAGILADDWYDVAPCARKRATR